MWSRHRQGFLLDTNVISETSKKRKNEGVLLFLEEARTTPTYLSVMTLGELRLGVYRLQLRRPDEALSILRWVEDIETNFKEHTIDIDRRIADTWAQLCVERDRPRVDMLLAATARVHELTLVTRNIRDYAGLDINLHNPWQS